MDKITTSDKFKQLKLNIESSNHLKKGFQRLERHTTFRSKKNEKVTAHTVVRKSPRRGSALKKLDIKQLYCSLTKKNGMEKRSHSEPQAVKENFHADSAASDIKNATINLGPKSNKVTTLIKENDRRDSSGFLKPTLPAPKKNTYSNFVNESFKTFNELIQDLAEPNLFEKVETAYHFEKLISHLNKTAFKKFKNLNPTLTPSSNIAPIHDRIHSWLQTSQALPESSKLTESRLDNLEKSSKVNYYLNENLTNVSEGFMKKNATCFLKDWSIIKGSREAELMLSGTLIDPLSRKVIEQNHKSSNILEKCGEHFVKTIFCTYQLLGKFIDEGASVPCQIKKYFEQGKFPDNWKSIMLKWNSLNSTLSHNKSKRTIKRPPEDIHNNDILMDGRAKKMRAGCSELCFVKSLQTTGGQVMPETRQRSLLNSSVLTRSAMRRHYQKK